MKKVRVDFDIDIQPSVLVVIIDASYEFEEFCDNIFKDLIDLGKIKISLWL
jgi:hypothetical protein